MNAKTTLSETVHVRLTMDQQMLLEAHAEARGLTLSEWALQTLLETLEASPMEHRLMNFIAAQHAATRLSLEEWQAGRDLTDSEVQARVMRGAVRSARDLAGQISKAISENGEAA